MERVESGTRYSILYYNHKCKSGCKKGTSDRLQKAGFPFSFRLCGNIMESHGANDSDITRIVKQDIKTEKHGKNVICLANDEKVPEGKESIPSDEILNEGHDVDNQRKKGSKISTSSEMQIDSLLDDLNHVNGVKEDNTKKANKEANIIQNEEAIRMFRRCS